MHHVPLAVKFIYECSNEGGKNGDVKGAEGVEIAWALGFVW